MDVPKKDEPVKDEKVVCLIQEGKWLQMEQRDSNNERMGNIHMKEPEQWVIWLIRLEHL